MFMKKVLFIIFCFVLSFSSIFASDYSESIEFLKNEKVINDCMDQGITANSKINIGNFLTLVWRSNGYFGEKEDLKKKNIKNNLKQNTCFYSSVSKTIKNDFMNIDNTFHYNKKISRADALELFFKINGVAMPRYKINPQKFLDCREDSREWAIAQKVYEFELMDFKKSSQLDGLFFSPRKNLTYGEAAEIIYRFNFRWFYNNPEPEEESSENLTTTVVSPNYSNFVSKEKFYILEHINNTIDSSFLPTGDAKVDNNQMIYGAAKGLVHSLNDPYSVFFTPEENAAFSADLNNEIVGIGVHIEEIKGKFIIASVIKDSPADKANLKVKDVIVKVDNIDLIDKDLFDLASLIRGKENSIVKLEILRKNSTKNFSIKREKISLKTVEWEKDGDIAVISIYAEYDTTVDEFFTVIKEIKKWKKTNKFILDLRGNPGGYLDSAVSICSAFLEKGSVVVLSEDKNKAKEVYKTSRDIQFPNAKIVILIDEGTASAGEVIAGTLGENGAKIVGKKSFGKGTAQALLQFDDGSSLKITIARWLLPSGKWVGKSKIEPDYEIEDDEETEKDEQYEKAKKVFNNF